MKTFTKTNLNALRVELDAVLKAFGEKHGIEMKTGKGKFTANTFDVTVNSVIAGAKTIAEDTLDAYLDIHNLNKVGYMGDTLVEYQRRNHKYPFIYTSARDGKRYKCTLEEAKRRFAK